MLKVVLVIGPETPMDLLLLTHFLKAVPECELHVCIQRSGKFTYKKFKSLLKVLKNSGLRFFLMNVVLNVGSTSWLMFDKASRPSTVSEAAHMREFSHFSFERINSEETLALLKKINPDVIFNHMAQRIKYPLINAFPQKIINIHPGLLPEFQGMGSCVWPLINGAKYSGASLHFIDSEEFDVGPLITTGRFVPRKGTSPLYLQVQARVIAALLAVNVIKSLQEGKILESRVQEGGTYRKLPLKDDLKALRSNGYRFLSWKDRKRVGNGEVYQFEYNNAATSWEWKPWQSDEHEPVIS